MSESQEKLARQWRAIHEGAGRAIAWIDAVRGNSSEDKADGLIYGLRRASNKARSLERAAGHPMAIGFSACPRRASLFDFHTGGG